MYQRGLLDYETAAFGDWDGWERHLSYYELVQITRAALAHAYNWR